ncbi:M14 family metallopeptidase [Flavobacterium aquicola]|uniref:Zinc carboxypeptidase n=1 Tax=Flavobacterium aquicola TaxID=1682742 RepID=A0A3E0DZB4_9FLAO|nr:M14 family metallopeptidase [Flavobacterium aquicola]REG90793.1 zinc carboxypeptidase [Flavobacterium aquicola]
MTKKNNCPFLLYLFLLGSAIANAQSILPPEIEWHGKSESLIAKPNNPWITPTEKANFRTTPSYQETMIWLQKLDAASPLLKMISIGKSDEGRDINMIIASSDKNITAASLKSSAKPLLLVQAGIHSGEIDGKDAGMMLLRDIAFGNKKSLLDKVNFLFIPILSVDAHERSSAYNRPNQRGPENMGWRTNAQNLNLNRDYAKLDTKEIRAVIKVINDYDPEMYMDIHVTDGADYQYDITFGGIGQIGYSPAIEKWLSETYKPFTDKDLSANGHIPGALTNAFNDKEFSQGNVVTTGAPRFSDSYGDARHLASVLVENHSLKPFKQRVLGTYVLLESTLKLLANEGNSLHEITKKDKDIRPAKVPMAWKIPQMKQRTTFEALSTLQNSENAAKPADSITFLAIDSKIQKSAVTNSDYVEWLGRPVTMHIADYKSTEPIDFISRPKGYWIPASCGEIITRLKLHGITMTALTDAKEITVEMYRITDYKFQDENQAVKPFEGHMQVDAATKTEVRKQLFPAGSVYVSTDQPLGDLAMLLLETASKDSYFSWGFFLNIFQRTEYIEAYIMEPMAKKMLDDSPALQKEFEEKKANDAAFANNPSAILSWFYSKTKFYDERYLLYPIGRVL